MKKLVIMGLLIFIVSVGKIYADSDSMDTYMQIKVMLETGMHMSTFGYSQVQTLAAGLGADYKLALYYDYKKTAVGPFFANLLVPGLGNFMLGNKTGGTIIMSAWFGGFVVAMFGILIWDDTVMTVGALTMLSGGVAALITPWTYTAKYNRTLKETLGVYQYVAHQKEMGTYIAANRNLINLNVISLTF